MGSFLAHDQPGPFRPGAQVDQIGDLRHPGAVSDLFVGFYGRTPIALWDRRYRLADGVVDGETEAEPDATVAARVGEVMGAAAVFDPAFPRLTIPASASPEEISGRSRNKTSGWNPKVRFQVGAANSF